MNTLTPNAAGSVSVTVKQDGVPVAVAGSVSASLRTMYGAELVASKAVLSTEPGAKWAVGLVVVPFTDVETAGLEAGDALLVVTGTFGSKTFAVSVEAPGQISRSLLFIRDVAVDLMRRDRLMLAAKGALPEFVVSDDYIWDKLRAAESEIAHELRVPLSPTTFFPFTPTADEIAALDGKPWGVDPGYDYDPQAFGYNDKWGLIKTRNKPLQSVSRVRFAYPGGNGSHYDLPLDWLRMDKKYGTIQFVPSSTAFIAPLNAFVMQAIGNGRTIPLAVQLTYVAGLENVPQNYPELLDVVLKKAALKIIEDAFLPQSGSISADGLSQSVSNDMEKHRDTIDNILFGGKGSNGGLMSAIHGVRIGVLGC